MKTVYIFLSLLFFSLTSFAQKIMGKVTDEQGNALIGANLIWLNTQKGTTTNTEGHFELEMIPKHSGNLLVSYVGYHNDTILIQKKVQLEIVLKSTVLDELVVNASKSNLEELRATEIITLKDLRKAACCNLSESFETNASVDVVAADAISGTKQIRMLGLDGIYTQITTENIPSVRGLAARSGLYFIPGTWISAIDVSKGVGSVVNGYESITGQINVELQKPENSERFFVNLYANEAARSEANLHFTKKINEKWSTLLLTHASNLAVEHDRNKDGFLDQPWGTQINLLNRWKYKGENMESQLGIKYLFDEKIAGQGLHHRNMSHTLYRIFQRNQKAEFFAKTGFFLKDNKSIGLITNYSFHDLASNWGNNYYNAQQNYAYFNAIYQHQIDEKNTYKLGTSLINDRYQEVLNDSVYGRSEKIVGLFGEYNYNMKDKFSAVIGLRADYHNLFGLITTPRLHLKYMPNEQNAIRISAGRGLRVANLIAENWAYLMSSRKIIFKSPLQPEIAWNYGISWSREAWLWDRKLALSMDFFRTDFENQIVVDLFTPQQVSFYNLNAKSFANSFQAQLDYEFLGGFDVSFAYKFYDIRSNFKENIEQKPFVSQHRFFSNFAYESPNEKWNLDLTVQYFGKQRLIYQDMPYSPNYWLVNTQVTRVFGNLEVYLGAENLLDYRQVNPIRDFANPFGANFDASNIYAPIMGRMVYAGLRWSIN